MSASVMSASVETIPTETLSSETQVKETEPEGLYDCGLGFLDLIFWLRNYKKMQWLKTTEDVRKLCEEWETTLNTLRRFFNQLDEEEKKNFEKADYSADYIKYIDPLNDEECFCEQCFVNRGIIGFRSEPVKELEKDGEEEEGRENEEDVYEIPKCACGNSMSPEWNECGRCKDCCDCEGKCNCDDKHCDGECGTMGCGRCVDVCRCRGGRDW